MTDIVERLRICATGPGDTHTVVICRLTRDTARDAAVEIERLRAEVHKLSTTCGHCGDLERAWAEAAAARDEGGREALTGALHPEFGSIYAPNGAATVAHEAGRREGIEAALTAALRMWPEADDLHDAIRTLLEEGGR